MSDTFECVTRDCDERFTKHGGKCPKCGLPVMTPETFRRSHGVRIGAGAFITAIMAVVLFYAAPMTLGYGDSLLTSHDLSPILILIAMVLVLLIGLTLVVGVALEMRDGARSRYLMKVVLALGAGVIGCAVLLSLLEPDAPGIRGTY